MGTATVPAQNNTKSGPPAAKGTETVGDLMRTEGFKKAVAAALPAHLKAERFMRVALTTLTRTPKLQQCDQASFASAMLTLSQLGLEPDGRRAHLIPFQNAKRGCFECQVIVDYKGIVELVMRSGKVSNIHADVVCENDVFEYDRGELKAHKPNFRQPRGEVYAVYALIRFKDGSEKCEVMTREEVEEVRKRSRASKAGPWVTDWNEMAKKTVFRRLSKWLELSPELRDAVEADDDHFNGTPVADKPLQGSVTLSDIAQLPMPDDEYGDTDPDSEDPLPSKPVPNGNGGSKPQAAAPVSRIAHGKESPAWGAFQSEFERVGNNIALSTKDVLGWVNVPFEKLNTRQLTELTAELAKINPDAEPS